MSLDRETWRFINSFAAWLSAIGTLASVTTALYLAARSGRPRIRIRTDMYVTVGYGQDRSEYLQVHVTNVGLLDVTIQNVTWRTGIFKKTKYVQLIADEPLSAKVPTKLKHSETAAYMFPVALLKSRRDPVSDNVRAYRFARLAVRAVRAGVVSTTGGEHWARVGRNVQKELLTNWGRDNEAPALR